MADFKMHSRDCIQDNLNKIMELFPQCFVEINAIDGIKKKIDFELLKQELMDEIDTSKAEKYSFDWVGKAEAKLLANLPIAKTLRPIVEKSINFSSSDNLFISGDNLDVLKLLQESYLDKVKVIYIDPPYNTGNDFIYDDDFKSDFEDYLIKSNQSDLDGNYLVSNSEANGRFHSDWLSMMYSRIKLARVLLKEDGVIFISIDDREVANLRKLCEEVFGSDNFVATFPWRKRTAKSDVPFGVSQDYEWILCFAKSSKTKLKIMGKERKYFTSEDYPNRPWRIHDLTKQTTASERPNSFFTMKNPKTGEEFPANPNSTWRITKDTFQEYYERGKIVFPGDYPFLKISKPVMRYFKDDDMKKAGNDYGTVALSTKLPDDIGMSLNGTKEITELFDGKKVFSYPKPVSLLKYLIKASTGEGDIILDFFAGSGTTAHATIELNSEDNLNRKFILVQLPEGVDEKTEAYSLGYRTISDLAFVRIAKIINEKNSECASSKIGCRYLYADSSNMKDVFYTPDALKQSDLVDLASNIKEDRTSEDLLFQVMLDWGLELSLPIERKTVTGKEVFYVAGNSLVACFDELTFDVVDEVAKDHPLRFVSAEKAIHLDHDKTNIKERFKQLSPDTEVKFL
ncbi:site-specific DNA-methyltransferase [Acinetobacter bereziniae]|uniref:site-specific DNA-methyltransferase n=1 Tax=Acinetobacter bereziniae TaxID=106648 RepID=UPI0028140B42|nr:site-specific DNA-methyltransferase [Acinetobacter bereziniae]MDQ9817804.1 site-specific DNA-methyltransferase [Acinetobacter bereziniae]